MISTLKLVQGAVSKKDILPVLTFLHIYDGRIQAGNGSLSIDAPFTFFGELNVTVPAAQFIRAINTCGENARVTLDTEKQKLKVTNKKFRATLPVMDNAVYPRASTLGEPLAVQDGFLQALRIVRPFVSEDASRPWSRSVLLHNGFAHATNNVVYCRTMYGTGYDMSIPVLAVDELLRIGQEPERILVADNSISFELPGGLWIHVKKQEAVWPDISKLLPDSVRLVEYGEELLRAVESVLPFCEDQRVPVIELGADGVSTVQGTQHAQVDIKDLPESRFRAEPLLAVLRIATKIDFSAYPKPCAFISGNNTHGVLVGVY